MRHLKLLLVAFAVTMSTALYANPASKFTDENSVSAEIENLLEQSCYAAEENFTVTVFFSISQDNRIQSISVASSNEAINEYLQAKLVEQELPGDFWKKGKIYELSVTRKAS